MTQNKRTAMITGANSGVGFELTRKLLSEHWDVIALIRSDFPGKDMIIQQAELNKKLRIYNADISDFRSLKSALENIKKNEDYIDVLFNNAGVGIGELRYSPQGRELHYEVNTVAPFIIAMEMKGHLKNGTNKTIVNISSNIIHTVKNFDLQALEKPVNFKKLFGSYALSKLALSLWTKQVSQIMKPEGIEIRSVCPGGNKTQMTAGEGMPFWLKLLANFLFPHPKVGAKKVFEAFNGFNGVTGEFIERGKVKPIKFTESGGEVLNKVRYIYTHEYLHLS